MGVMPPHFDHLRRGFIAAALFAVIGGGSVSGAPSPVPVVTILGDSITAGFGLPAGEALPAQLQLALGRRGVSAVVRGAGVSGDTTAGALARADFSVQSDTAVCVVELGGNDFLQSIPPSETERNLRAIVAKLQRRKITVVLAAGRVPDRVAGAYGRELSGIFPRVAKDTRAILSPDLLAGVFEKSALKQEDGLHPSAAGARLVADRLSVAVAKALGSRRPHK